MSVVLNVWKQGGGSHNLRPGKCGWVRKYFPGAVSGEIAWRELKQAKPIKGLLGGRVVYAKSEGRKKSD